MRFVRIGDAAKELGVCTSTLRRWADQDKIPHRTSPGGHRFVDVDSYLEGKSTINIGDRNEIKASVFYCRVSSSKQRDDLERQTNLARQRYPNHEIVSDIGSGLNWHRRGLKSILARVMCREIKEVVIFHRDRLCRFGFELVEFIITSNGAELVVLDDEDKHKSSEQELAEDLLAITTIFSCRQMGKRRYPKDDKKVDDGEDIPISRAEEETSDMDDRCSSSV